MKILITGGAGFIGVHLVDQLLRLHNESAAVVLDAGRHTAVPQALPNSDRIEFVSGTILDTNLLIELVTGCDAVIHLAAETFVDASIVNNRAFIDTNICGTAALLRVMNQVGDRRLLHVSTDEVFGEATNQPFTETTAYNPRNPYSATKAAADHLVRAYAATYGLDAVICHCSNLFGRWQYPEKLIPVSVARLLSGDRAHLYGNGQQTRTWLHVTDAAAGLLAAFEHGTSGNSYLIGGEDEKSNLDIITTIAGRLDIPADEAISFVPDRPGHDARYALDTSATCAALGWKPAVDIDTGLAETIDWMIDNHGWWKKS